MNLIPAVHPGGAPATAAALAPLVLHGAGAAALAPFAVGRFTGRAAAPDRALPPGPPGPW